MSVEPLYNTLPKNIEIHPYTCEISFDLLTDTNNQLINTLKHDKDNASKFSYLTNRFISIYMDTLYFTKLPDTKEYVGLVTYDLKSSIYVIAYYKKMDDTMLKLIGIDTPNNESSSSSDTLTYNKSYNTPKTHNKPTTLPYLIDNFNLGIEYNNILFNNQNTELIYVYDIDDPLPQLPTSTIGGARKYRSKKANKNKRCKTSKTKKLRGGLGNPYTYIKNKYTARRKAKQAKIDEELKRKAAAEAAEEAAAEKNIRRAKAIQAEKDRKSKYPTSAYIKNLIKSIENSDSHYADIKVEVLNNILANPSKYRYIKTIGELETELYAHIQNNY